jgi:hypothetical protein
MGMASLPTSVGIPMENVGSVHVLVGPLRKLWNHTRRGLFDEAKKKSVAASDVRQFVMKRIEQNTKPWFPSS